MIAWVLLVGLELGHPGTVGRVRVSHPGTVVWFELGIQVLLVGLELGHPGTVVGFELGIQVLLVGFELGIQLLLVGLELGIQPPGMSHQQFPKVLPCGTWPIPE